MRKVIPYKSHLVGLARSLRKNMTLSEVLLWNEIKNRQLGYHFSRQIPIDNYIVDFFCKDLFLAIEIDGESHNHPEQVRKDIQRQNRLESLGVHFLRFDDLDVKTNIEWVLAEIQEKIKKLIPTPDPSEEGN